MTSVKNYQIPDECIETVKELTLSEVSLEIGINYMTLSKKLEKKTDSRHFWNGLADACIFLLTKKIESYQLKIKQLKEWKSTLTRQ